MKFDSLQEFRDSLENFIYTYKSVTSVSSERLATMQGHKELIDKMIENNTILRSSLNGIMVDLIDILIVIRNEGTETMLNAMQSQLANDAAFEKVYDRLNMERCLIIAQLTSIQKYFTNSNIDIPDIVMESMIKILNSFILIQ